MASLLELDQCLHSSGPVAPDSLDEQLEKVNKLDTQEKDYTDQQIIDLIVLGTTKIPIQHKASSSFCHFIYKQCTKQIRVSSFRASSFEKCLTYLLGGLDGDQVPGELVVDILRALSALIYENSGNTSKFYTRLTPCLLKYAERSVKPLEIRRMAINCLGNLCAGAGSKLQLYYKDIYQVLLSNLAGQTSKSMMISFTNLDLNDSAVRKVASSTLRALQFLLSQDRTLVTNPLCDIIDIIHIFLFMHVNVQSYQQLYASDSEMSDSDGMSFNPRRCRDDAKIRLNTLLCLLAIAKTQPKILYPHWQKFIPDTFSVFLKNHTLSTTGSTPTLYSISPILRSDHQPSSLLTLLLYDPMVTVRVAVCHTLIAMLDGSKQYLSMASKR
ncbi:hypothetical protein BC941DRAFT_462137 [Chlamydoabsidia padenii]|nr:hypothetical protein BC941DRAFT_462137 [Chlamydoabsidia padenii]